jgi:hypothetical protein
MDDCPAARAHCAIGVVFADQRMDSFGLMAFWGSSVRPSVNLSIGLSTLQLLAPSSRCRRRRVIPRIQPTDTNTHTLAGTYTQPVSSGKGKTIESSRRDQCLVEFTQVTLTNQSASKVDFWNKRVRRRPRKVCNGVRRVTTLGIGRFDGSLVGSYVEFLPNENERRVFYRQHEAWIVDGNSGRATVSVYRESSG